MIIESGTSKNGYGLVNAVADLISSGDMKFYELSPLIRMVVNQCVLKEDLRLKKTGSHTEDNEITFSFRNLFQGSTTRLLPSVQVSSSGMDVEVFVPAGTDVNVILIIVHADLLKDLLSQKKENLLLQNMISGHHPFLYEEVVSPEMQHVAREIVDGDVPEELQEFYFKLKAQEMIYLFFVELLKRQNVAGYPLNGADVKTMYAIKDKVLSNISIVPNLTELTQFSNMSESKMNRLFKQIFGASIYSYYQMSRMKEAAYLIKEEKLSVSETGYRLGFTNLSHFSRIFEKHIGTKPKKYSSG